MHRLLQRQISRFLDSQAAMPEGLSLFLAAVDDAYESADADRSLIEHSLELMSQELTERNTDLRTQLVERQHAEAQLENLLSLLGTTLESTADGILALDKEGTTGALQPALRRDVAHAGRNSCLLGATTA